MVAAAAAVTETTMVTAAVVGSIVKTPPPYRFARGEAVASSTGLMEVRDVNMIHCDLTVPGGTA